MADYLETYAVNMFSRDFDKFMQLQSHDRKLLNVTSLVSLILDLQLGNKFSEYSFYFYTTFSSITYFAIQHVEDKAKTYSVFS